MMNWTIHKTEGQPFITVTTEGSFNLKDHLKMVEDIVSSEFWQPGTNVFFDHRNLCFGLSDITVMQGAGKNHEKNDERIGDGKAAILMKSLTDFGRGRQFEMLTDDKVNARLHIFLDEKKAVNWLLK